MGFFTQEGNSVIFRENGETVKVCPWGENSLRVRSTILQDIQEGSVALLDVEELPADIVLGETEASIRNGNLTAKLVLNTWGNFLQISFYNQKGELLLSEISHGGALQKKARHFKALPGGSYRLTAGFVGDREEKIYELRWIR